jgi:hypothetical protein
MFALGAAVPREKKMKKSILAIAMASSLSLGACATTDPYAQDDTLRGAGTGAAIGAAAGGALGAAVGGLGVIEGAAIGAAVGGLAGAVWADSNNDGYADGYVREGRYYEGRPQSSGYAERSCPTTLGGAATGAAIGGVGGAGVGAVVGGINPLQGAAIGAVVGGIAGAIWADRNNDGCVDGYVREGRYYEGAPQPTYQAQPVYRAGERG